MKRRLLFGGVAFIAVVVMIAVIYNSSSTPKGTTIESREQILNAAIQSGENWSIATETEIDGYIISAAYSTDGKASLAIFRPGANGGYEFQTSTNRNADAIIISSVIINQNSYDLVWFNGAQTEYAELLYTIRRQPQDALKFNTNDMRIIYVQSPAKEYSLSVSYYDRDGNKYE